MLSTRRNVVKAVGLAAAVVLVTLVGLPGIASAAPTPLYPECPAAGPDTGCAVLVSVNADGSTTVSTDSSQPPLSPTGVLVGFVNNSSTTVNSVALTGTAGPGAFALTGQGVCAVQPGPCISTTEFGPTGYEGPGTSFVTTEGVTTSGTVDFAGGMAPGKWTYFSLASAPITVASLALVPDVSVTASTIAPFANAPFDGQVGTFTAGYSTSPAGDFSATMNWGDGTTGPVSVGQPGGPGTPYVVTGTHTYTGLTTYATDLTVTDVAIPSNTGSSSATADVSSLAATPITSYANLPFDGQVGTFTVGDSTSPVGDFSATMDWGDGTTGPVSVGQPGGSGTPYVVTGTHTYTTPDSYTTDLTVTSGTIPSLDGTAASTATVSTGTSFAATPITSYANLPFDGQVGTFTVGDSTSPVGDFSATMDWGDGTTGPVSVGQPGGSGTPYVVTGTHTYTAPDTYPTDLTVTDEAYPAVTGSSSSTATVTTIPPVLSSEPIGTQVVGTAFSGPVATFTSGDPTTTSASFDATIDWGAQAGGIEQISDGTVTQPGGPGTPYTVTGTNTYAASGDFTITVTVTDGAATGSVTEPVEVNAVEVTVPCTGDCSGQVSTPVETASGTTTSDTGSIYVALGNDDLVCAGNYDSAPQVTTVTTTGVPTTSTVDVKVVFERINLQVQGTGGPVAVCFESTNPFVQQDGTETQPSTVDGQTVYTGLLPSCKSNKALRFGPCVAHLSKPSPGWKKKYIELLRFPGGDPKAH